MSLLILRVFNEGKLGSRMEVALGHSGEYPRVIFRSTVFCPSLIDEGATLRDLLEELGEELFNVGAYAEALLAKEGSGASGEDPESSVQLLLDTTLGGGGRGGSAGDGSEAKPLDRSSDSGHIRPGDGLQRVDRGTGNVDSDLPR